MNGPVNPDRRQVLAGGGALIVSFSLSNAFAVCSEAILLSLIMLGTRRA